MVAVFAPYARGVTCDPVTMKSVSREPQLPERHLIRTSGVSPWPARTSAGRSASTA
jgi:hypothetical protein